MLVPIHAPIVHVTRCNPPGIKIDIMAKRCVICHLKAWTLLIIVA